jgi:hypothetical protein
MRQKIPKRPERPDSSLPFRARRAGRAGLPVLCALAAALAGCMNDSKKADPRLRLLDLRITEVHYNPLDEGDVDGNDFEFVEIKNTGTSALDLSEVGFTEGIEFTFEKGTTLGSKEHLVLASIPARFQSRYGFAPHGAYTGQLSNSGETLVLMDLGSRTVIDSVTWSDEDGWPGGADGGGYSLVPLTASADDQARPWRLSFRLHGSPGADDIVAALVNEVSPHTDPPDRDAVELHNPDAAPLDVGGWWLSDDREVPAKFRIPSGTTIPAKGYLVLDEEDFNADSASARSFRLSEHGEEIWLFSDSAGCEAGYCHGFAFGPIENGSTFGRYVAGDGGERFPAQKAASLGTENAGPRVGPVVITEVMYHAPNDTDDFLEIANAGAAPVALFDTAHPAHTWRVQGMGFSFPPGITLAPGEVALVLPARATEARIRAAYGVGSAVRIFQAAGELGNSTDTLELQRPGEPFVREGASPGDTSVPYIVADRVAYRDSGPWPNPADGEGESLRRKDPEAFGDDPDNWAGDPPTAGKVDP